MQTSGQIGFVPDRSQPAILERGRLWRTIAGADRAGYENLAAELREADSELFDVTTTDDGPFIVEWRLP